MTDIYLTGSGPATSVRMEERAQSALVTLENSGRQYSAYCKSKVVSRVVVIIVVVSN